ncbi:MAG: response regulator [Myxococcales bacterium]|nr:response regulator [Myxococcales bacterium]
MSAQDPAARAAAPSPRPMLVLVVEDDEKTRKLVGQVVRKGGYRAVLAEDGIQAASVLKKARPDLIILDIRMPRMDGFKLLELLQRYETAASIPVVMLTASDSPLDLDRALRLGVQDYLVKPISPKALLLKVRALLKPPAS